MAFLIYLFGIFTVVAAVGADTDRRMINILFGRQ
jgi:hypothetical protein